MFDWLRPNDPQAGFAITLKGDFLYSDFYAKRESSKRGSEPSKRELQRATTKALANVAKVHSLLKGHFDAWVKADRKTVLMLLLDWERSEAINNFLRESRPEVTWETEFGINPARTICWYPRVLNPQTMALDLFVHALIVENDTHCTRLCEHCRAIFIPFHKNKRFCCDRCRMAFYSRTEVGRERRNAEKRRNRRIKKALDAKRTTARTDQLMALSERTSKGKK